jgi:hypothetical protein
LLFNPHVIVVPSPYSFTACKIALDTLSVPGGEMGEKRGSRSIVIGMILETALCATSGAGDRSQPSWYHVNNRINTKAIVPAPLLWQSQDVVSEIFTKIGIDVTWRAHRGKGSKEVATVVEKSAQCDLTVEIVDQAPANLNPRAIAMALPFGDQGARIVIFYERVIPVLREHRDHQATILGYVLAHELGHILQGVTHHSLTGIMRARWTEDDFAHMSNKELTFTVEDVVLMKRYVEWQLSLSAPLSLVDRPQLFRSVQ